MLKMPSDPGPVSLSTSIYRALLGVYPAHFKQEYAKPMLQVFRDCCRGAYQEGGNLALLGLWGWTTLDYLKTIIDEYIKGGTHMTRDKLIKSEIYTCISIYSPDSVDPVPITPGKIRIENTFIFRIGDLVAQLARDGLVFRCLLVFAQ